MTSPLICPVCSMPLEARGHALVCGEGHSFDLASSGYCNLLRPGKQHNRVSGDDREMVAARGRFLAAGYYEPVLNYIVSKLAKIMNEGGLLIDAGCGEGYYTNGIAARLPGITALGVDASKHAANAAAKGASRMGVSGRVMYITASSSSVPVPDGAADAVLSLFSPCDYAQFSRVTKPGGCLLIGSAGIDHLREMKEVLYGRGNVRPNVPIDHPAFSAAAGFIPVSRENVIYKTEINGKEYIDALFSMTPYRWRSPRDGVAALSLLEGITVTVDVDFTLLQLQKKGI